MKEVLVQHSFFNIIWKSFSLTLSSFLQYIGVILIVIIPLIAALFSFGLAPLLFGEVMNLKEFLLKNLMSLGAGLFFIVLAVILYMILSQLFIAIYMSKIIANKYLGEKITTFELIKSSLKKLFPAFIMMSVVVIILLFTLIIPFIPYVLFSGKAILAESSNTALSIIAVICLSLPFIFTFLGFFLSLQTLVLDQSSIIDSIKKSWSLMSGERIKTILLLLCVLIIQLIIEYSIFLSIALFAKFIPADFVLILFILSIIISFALRPVYVTMQVLLYFNLKLKKENYSLEKLVENFSVEQQYD